MSGPHKNSANIIVFIFADDSHFLDVLTPLASMVYYFIILFNCADDFLTRGQSDFSVWFSNSKRERQYLSES